MIIAIDIETQGLDATKYILGCLVKENTKKAEFYEKKQDLWKRVLELGISEAKRKKVLNVYSHNAQYDTAGYVDLKDPHLVFFSNRPFIWAYRLTKEECRKLGIEPNKETKIFRSQEGYNKWKAKNSYREIISTKKLPNSIAVTYYLESKEIIKFLDTMSIYRMSLANIGVLLGKPKTEMPLELLEEDCKITKELIEKVKPYVENDTRLCLEAVQYIKEKIREEGVEIKRLYTINQIAIGFIVNKLLKLPDEMIEPMFWNKDKGITRRTFRKEEIHASYRGGRVEPFKLGIFENVTYVDCNSLYPYSLMSMDFPDLRTERKVYKPLEKMNVSTLLGFIGLSRCYIYNKSNDLGLLQIRTDTGNYYPRKGVYFIGTYTHQELRKALQEGYEILEIEWSVIFKETFNPFTMMMKDLYKQRKSGSEFNNYFYKMMMNASIGKMAQHRSDQIIVVDCVEKAEEYLARNYKIIKGVNLNYMFTKQDVEFRPKPYYMPIVASKVNAFARCYMYDLYKKVHADKIVYTDTDSLMYEHYEDPYKLFDIGSGLGQFKIVCENTKAKVYGKKTYSIGSDIRVSGFSKKHMTNDDFEKGIIKNKFQITVNSTNDVSQVGKFREETRDLLTQIENYKKSIELLQREKMLIDCDIEDINFFLPKIVRV